MSRPQNNFTLNPTIKIAYVLPQKAKENCPLGPQKVKNDPKNESKLNVRIERNKENENCSTT